MINSVGMQGGTLLILTLAGCSVDSYGVRGTKYMLAEMARSRVDGSLACAVAFSKRSTVNLFDVSCSYEPNACTCTGVSADRLPEGLSFPLSVCFSKR